jgi:hypothetical protein
MNEVVKPRGLTDVELLLWFIREFGVKHPLAAEWKRTRPGTIDRGRVVQEIALRVRLLDSLERFERGGEIGDNGLLGAMQSLASIFIFLDYKLHDEKKALLNPLHYTVQTLIDLVHYGIVRPMLRPKKNRGNSHSWELVHFKSRCLLAADLLIQAGRTRRQAEEEIVSHAIVSAGRLGVRLTKKTFPSWRRALRADKARPKGFESPNLEMGMAIAINQFDPGASSKLSLVWSSPPAHPERLARKILKSISSDALSHLAS